MARIAGTLFVAGFAIFALLLLGVRFIIFPRIDENRDAVTAMLSRQLGHPVEIASLTTGWDGWNPKLVIGGFHVRDAALASDVPLLDLPEVELIVAWTSLPFLELRLKELVIDEPRLAIRRDRKGILHVAGLEFDPAAAGTESPVLEWLARQHQIVVRDALITWNDDARNAPQLVLDRVQFKLENRFGRHRFGLRGTPPNEMAAPIDVRGDFSAISTRDWKSGEGTLYVRLDFADVTAWREWLPLPVPIVSGKGATRVWLEFAQGEARNIVADLELQDVRATLGDGLPPLDLAHVSGRIAAKSSPMLYEIATRDLAFVTTSGQRLDPTNFMVSLNEPDGPAPTGRMEFDHLQLAPLSELAVHLPLPERWRTELARFAPRGTVEHGHLAWQGPLDAPVNYSIAAEFSDLGYRAHDRMPGATGVSGSIAAKQTGGDLKIAAQNATLDWPGVFANVLVLDRIDGTARWERKGDRTAIRFDRLDFALPIASGTLSGTFRTDPEGPGEIEMTGQLSNVDVREVYRYVPMIAGEATREWLKTGFVAGTASDARVKLNGNLSDFPFADGKNGQFLLASKMRGVTLAYANEWPPLEAADGEFRFEGAKISIDVARGHTYDLKLGRLRAEIPDVRVAVPVLRLDGDSSGPVSDFLRFMDASPVAAMIGHVFEGVEGSGTAHLATKLELPLGKPQSNRVSGEIALANAEFRLAGMPTVSQVTGKIGFTEREVHARDVSGDVAGGPARISVATSEGRVHVTGSGAANLVTLRQLFPSQMLDRVTGMVDWTLAADVREGASTFQADTTMKGATIDLPAPLGKTAVETVPLRLQRRVDLAHPSDDEIVVSYGSVMQLVMMRKRSGENMATERALLVLGRAAEGAAPPRPERSGLWVRADLAQLNIDDWLSLRRSAEASESFNGSGTLLSGIDLEASVLQAFGRRFNDMKLSARRTPEAWKLDVRARELAGTAQWTSSDPKAPDGRIVARLARFAMPAAGDLPSWPGAAKAAAKGRPETPEPWPAMDIESDSFVSNGRDLGRVEVIAQPNGQEWEIEKLVLANESGRIDAKGAWRTAGRAQQTRLDVALDAKDAGAFLTRFGYPNTVLGAPTKIAGQLSWAGAPSEFDYPTLSGAFNINVGPGRFTKIEPGIGKLLGVLSLQALPRRITLDFQDIFSEGFAFDEVTGKVRLVDGVMSTDDLRLVGPSAKVDIAGEADLARETQRLDVKVQPALSAGVSAGAALLFLANPIIGAAVGAGSLLAQKVLQDPIEQMFSFHYVVTGSWSEPVVTRGTGATASAASAQRADGSR